MKDDAFFSDNILFLKKTVSKVILYYTKSLKLFFL